MTDKAYECFKHLLEIRTKKQQEQCAGGQKGYLCFDGKDMPRYGGQWAKIFESIWQQYIKANQTALCKVTPHVCRHTFATNMARMGLADTSTNKVKKVSEWGNSKIIDFQSWSA